MTLLVLVGVIVATGLMYMTSQRELAPEEDQGILFTLVKTPQYANLDYLEDATQQLYKVYSTVPEKEHVFTINGMGDVHQGFAGILLKPWGERTRTQKEVLTELEPRISSIATAQAIAFSPPALPGSVGGPPIQFVITTTRDARELADVLADVEKSARESGMFIFSDSDLRFETPQIEFHIDHDKANRLGISMADIGSSLATLLGGNYVNLFDLYGRSYRVIPQVPRDFRLNESWLTRYQIRTASGTLVPLVECRDDHADGAAERSHQLPAAQFGDAVGGAFPRAHGRRGDRIPEGQGEELPRRLLLRLPGREPAVRAGGQHARLHLHLRAGGDLPRARGAI